MEETGDSNDGLKRFLDAQDKSLFSRHCRKSARAEKKPTGCGLFSRR